jgi:hypothetical protein
VLDGLIVHDSPGLVNCMLAVSVSLDTVLELKVANRTLLSETAACRLLP